MPVSADNVAAWIATLEARLCGDLEFRELRRAVQALSSVYVQRRDRLAGGAALDSAGKRAAFATFFAPLHFLTVERIVAALDAADPSLDQIVDLGCGTLPGAAAWAMASERRPKVLGFEINGWAATEARHTLEHWQLRGCVKRTGIEKVRLPAGRNGIIAAYAVNEINEDARRRLLRDLLRAHNNGSAALIVEPIAKRQVPWWDDWSTAFRDAGGRDDEWKIPVDLPDALGAIDRAARLDHSLLKARSLYLAARG